MADKKISALTAATTPLAGTEVLPIVQSGATVKVAVSDLTAGRGIAATSLTTAAVQASNSGGLALKNSGGTTQMILGGGGGDNITLSVATNITPANAAVAISPTGTGTLTLNPATASTINNMSIGATTALSGRFTDVTATTGNVVIGTSGQGIDFSATPGTGTSELLNDYETGSWTPALSSNAGSAGTAAVSSAYGIYTKVGNQVTISFSFQVDNVGSWSGAIQVAGIPFNFASGKVVIAATAVSNLTYLGQVAFEGALSAGDKLTLRTMATASAYSQVNVSGISAGNTVLYGTLTYYV